MYIQDFHGQIVNVNLNINYCETGIVYTRDTVCTLSQYAPKCAIETVYTRVTSNMYTRLGLVKTIVKCIWRDKIKLREG